MKRLLTTTALVLVSSTSVFASGDAATAIRDNLKDLYNDFGQIQQWQAAPLIDGEGNAASQYGELVHIIDNLGTHGLITFETGSAVSFGDAEIDGSVSNTVNRLGEATYDGSGFTMEDVHVQVDVFVQQLIDETVNTGGFVDEHLQDILVKQTEANNAIMAATTKAGRDAAAQEFLDYFNGVNGENGARHKFNNAVDSLAQISDDLNNITETNVDTYTLNLDRKTDRQQHIDWVNGDYVSDTTIVPMTVVYNSSSATLNVNSNYTLIGHPSAFIIGVDTDGDLTNGNNQNITGAEYALDYVNGTSGDTRVRQFAADGTTINSEIIPGTPGSWADDVQRIMDQLNDGTFTFTP